MWKVARHAFR